MKKKQLMAVAMAGALTAGVLSYGVTATASELPPAGNSTDYTITIPATLTVANPGWNATDGITAKNNGTSNFDSSKSLTVMAASVNDWNLKAEDNTVGYNLATATGDYSSEATPASWEFSAAELNAENGTNKAMGIIVDDYSSKPKGIYTDTVTFTAKVEDAATVLAPALENDATVVIAYRWNDYNTTTFTFTNNGGTYSCNVGGEKVSDFSGSLTLNGTTLALSITNSFMPDRINLAINFDTTNDTYSFVTKKSWYNSHTVSVNGTDITSKLTEAK